jgi:hypothetical protein
VYTPALKARPDEIIKTKKKRCQSTAAEGESGKCRQRYLGFGARRNRRCRGLYMEELVLSKFLEEMEAKL